MRKSLNIIDRSEYNRNKTLRTARQKATENQLNFEDFPAAKPPHNLALGKGLNSKKGESVCDLSAALQRHASQVCARDRKLANDSPNKPSCGLRAKNVPSPRTIIYTNTTRALRIVIGSELCLACVWHGHGALCGATYECDIKSTLRGRAFDGMTRLRWHVIFYNIDNAEKSRERIENRFCDVSNILLFFFYTEVGYLRRTELIHSESRNMKCFTVSS